MIKPFYVAGSLLLLIIFSIGVHYISGDRMGITDRVNAVASMTRMSSPSFSVAYYEPRVGGTKIGGVEKAVNIAYPEMMPLSRMDFVYEK